MDYFAHMSMRSRNGKTGPIPVSTTTALTCPSSCPLAKAGCYAKTSHLGMHWDKVTSGKRATSWETFCETVKALPLEQLWRHNQAGDLPGLGETIDRLALGKLVRANRGKRGFTYTHKPMTARNRQAVARANRDGFTVNLSANNLSDADRLYDLGIAPVVTILLRDTNANAMTPKGRLVVICPAVTHESVSCATCGLCQRAERKCKCIVGFPAHGINAKAADQIAGGSDAN